MGKHKLNQEKLEMLRNQLSDIFPADHWNKFLPSILAFEYTIKIIFSGIFLINKSDTLYIWFFLG